MLSRPVIRWTWAPRNWSGQNRIGVSGRSTRPLRRRLTDAADVGLGFDGSGGVDVADDDGTGCSASRRSCFGGDRVGEAAPGLQSGSARSCRSEDLADSAMKWTPQNTIVDSAAQPRGRARASRRPRGRRLGSRATGSCARGSARRARRRADGPVRASRREAHRLPRRRPRRWCSRRQLYGTMPGARQRCARPASLGVHASASERAVSRACVAHRMPQHVSGALEQVPFDGFGGGNDVGAEAGTWGWLHAGHRAADADGGEHGCRSGVDSSRFGSSRLRRCVDPGAHRRHAGLALSTVSIQPWRALALQDPPGRTGGIGSSEPRRRSSAVPGDGSETAAPALALAHAHRHASPVARTSVSRCGRECWRSERVGRDRPERGET